MRPLIEHSLDDWLQLRPITQSYKTARYNVLDFVYTHRRPLGYEEFLRDHAQLAGTPIAISTAFNQPALIEWQLRFWPHMVKDTVLLVADNSNDPAAAGQIAGLCRRANVAYLKLPPNPARQVWRSHGLAMNWTYRNLVRSLAPSIFAFIDHDLVPVEPTSFGELLGNQPFYGKLNNDPFFGARPDRTAGWNLWAGYCVFSYEQTKSRKLNFLNDWFIGLDTGGANWWSLYRHYNKSEFRFAAVGQERVPSINDNPAGELERIDGWLHAGRASQWHKGAD